MSLVVVTFQYLHWTSTHYLLDDIEVGSTSAAHIDKHWSDEHIFGKVLELLRHRGTEQQRLPLLLEVVHDALHL